MSHHTRRKDVRNIAIIAHVDHGKTTLVDALLKQSGAFEFKHGETTIMDSNPLERERGITIFSKNASIQYKGIQINIVDTPGHADFGSEVERILRMVDGVVLLVDAFEGPMPQTKFVLRKSLELHLKPILVINKIDRPHARPLEVADMTFDLFCDLNATDEQLDFPIVYASGRDGTSTLDLDEPAVDMKPLLETIIHRVLPPIADADKPFQMLVTMLDYDSYMGRIGVGRIAHGSIAYNQPIACIKRDGSIEKGKVTKILRYKGMARFEAQTALAGDIVCIAGVEDVKVGDTLAAADNPQALPTIKIDEPTMAMYFSHNTSPLCGKDGGRFLTSRHVRERLYHEAMINVGIHVEEVEKGDRLKVSGRGELHLAILIETMRREGYELEVSPPEVIMKKEGDETLEPIEQLFIEIEPVNQGAVMQALGERRAEMVNMETTSLGNLRCQYIVASRALLGFRSDFMLMTRGSGIMYHNFYEYQPFRGEIPERPYGVQVSQTGGTAVAFALFFLQDRGPLFIGPNEDLYEGMIVGIHNKGNDIVVNAQREKKLTNMRAAGSDENVLLTPPRVMTLEAALEFIEPDELVEITPKNIRLRKRFLTENERKCARRGTAMRGQSPKDQ